MNSVTPARLREDFEPLAQVPEAQLQFLIDKGQQRELATDEFLFRKDEPSNTMTLVLSGRIRIYTLQKNQSREITILEK